jgi:hypothetical protein
VDPGLVTVVCYQCRKEGKTFLIFFKPRGWIKHTSLDGIHQVFCSLECLEAYMGVKQTPKPKQVKKPVEVEEEQLLEATAR